jgi:hypothetical protein
MMESKGSRCRVRFVKSPRMPAIAGSNRAHEGVVVSKMTGEVVITSRRLRSVGRSVLLVCTVVASVVACGAAGPTAIPTPIPVVTIENESGVAVDVFSLSAKTGAILQATLADGGIYNAQPAGSRCDPEGSYFVVASGRRVATLERPGCTGGTLVITREMLTGPEVIVTPAP